MRVVIDHRTYVSRSYVETEWTLTQRHGGECLGLNQCHAARDRIGELDRSSIDERPVVLELCGRALCSEGDELSSSQDLSGSASGKASAR